MSYVDGYLVPVPIEKKQEYIEQAVLMADVFKEYGAIEIYENWVMMSPKGRSLHSLKPSN